MTTDNRQSTIDYRLPTTDKYWDEGIRLVSGCTPVSDGCQHCWSRQLQKRFKVDGSPDVVKFHVDRLKRFDRKQPAIFSIWNDLFHPAVTDIDIDMTLAAAALNPQHIFLILTKRIERAAAYFSHLNHRQERIGILAEYQSGLDRTDWTDEEHPEPTWHLPLPNVWLGTTVEGYYYKKRIGYLLQIPAAKHFVSFEPLLNEFMSPLRGRMGWNGRHIGRIDWSIIGAETGPGRRPCKIEWGRSLVQQCQEADISVWIKALDINGKITRNLADFPPDLQLRQFPPSPLLNRGEHKGGFIKHPNPGD